MLQLHNISLSFDQDIILRDINLNILDGEILCLLGPSGSGKTSLLRVIAGLENVDSGAIIFKDKRITDVPTHLRRFGLMFQDYALFPHLTVKENVEFGLKMNGTNRHQRTSILKELLDLVGLPDFSERDVSQLSGGEKQRVALARSLAPQPRFLMLDEPLGALDVNLRQHLLNEIRSIIKSLGLTAIYVTHDREEAFAIGDRIAVMRQGEIVQIDDSLTIFRHPKSVFVANFLKIGNVIPVRKFCDGFLMTDIGNFPAPAYAEYILIHLNAISVVDATSDDVDTTAIVESVVYLGEQYLITVKCGNHIELRLRINSFDPVIPKIGQEIGLIFVREYIVPLHDY